MTVGVRPPFTESMVIEIHNSLDERSPIDVSQFLVKGIALLRNQRLHQQIAIIERAVKIEQNSLNHLGSSMKSIIRDFDRTTRAGLASIRK